MIICISYTVLSASEIAFSILVFDGPSLELNSELDSLKFCWKHNVLFEYKLYSNNALYYYINLYYIIKGLREVGNTSWRVFKEVGKGHWKIKTSESLTLNGDILNRTF